MEVAEVKVDLRCQTLQAPQARPLSPSVLSFWFSLFLGRLEKRTLRWKQESQIDAVRYSGAFAIPVKHSSYSQERKRGD